MLHVRMLCHLADCKQLLLWGQNANPVRRSSISGVTMKRRGIKTRNTKQNKEKFPGGCQKERGLGER